MPRTLRVPASDTWSFSFDEGELPIVFLFPTAALAGLVIFTMSTAGGSSPPDPEGAIGTVVIDGGAPIATACLLDGSEEIAIPQGSLQVTLSAAWGCNAGADQTVVHVAGVGV